MKNKDITYMVVFEKKICKIRERLLIDCLQVYLKKKNPTDKEKQTEKLMTEICFQLGSMCAKLREKMLEFSKEAAVNSENEIILCNEIMEKFGMNKE